jgi:hypothetical protein
LQRSAWKLLKSRGIPSRFEFCHAHLI